MPEQIGLSAIWDNTDFQRGIASYLDGLRKANRQTDQTAGSLGAMGGAARGPAVGGMLALGGVIGATTSIVSGLIEKVSEAIAKVREFGADSIQTAGRVQELTIISQLLGQRAGLTAEEITAQIQAIKEVGIQTDSANLLFAQFARYQLDTAQAVDLAATAQNAAVFASQDSSQALEGLLHGILTYNSRVLRTYGLNVDIQGSFQKMAEELGTTTEALTEQQKIQATLNGVLAEGSRISGVYAAAMESPAKQARSLSRHIFELKNALGQPFLAAWGNVIGMITNFVKALGAAVSEGGALYPVLVQIGGIASLVTEGLAKIVGVATDAGVAFTGELAGRLGAAASQAFTWGANIVIQLATGIISGAGNAIIAAMNYISSLLSHWLSPGSPPKVAPDLVKWGIKAVGEWLGGFTQGDFSILKAIQNPLKSALDTLTDLGNLDKGQAGKLFANLSKDLIKQLKSGKVDEGFFSKLQKSAGVFGEELVDLAKKQIALAGAEQAVADAEAQLAKAREDEARAGQKVNQFTQEYNDMLRSGATKDELKAKLAAINAAKQEQQLAKQSAKDAEGKLDDAKSNLDVLKEQASLQQELLQQLIELARAQIKPPEPVEPKPAGGAGAPAGGPEVPGIGGIDPGSFTDPIADAVDKAKGAILAKLQELWETIKQKIREGMGDVGQRFAEAWARLVEVLRPIWEKIKGIVILALQFIGGEIQAWLEFFRGWWAAHGESIKTIVAGLWGFITNIVTSTLQVLAGLLSAGLEYLRGFWDRHGQQISTLILNTYEAIKTLIQNALEVIGNFFDAWAALFEGDWETFWNEVKDSAGLIWDSLKLAWDATTTGLRTIYDIFAAEFKLAWGVFWGAIQTKAQEIWEGIKTIIQEGIDFVKNTIETKVEELKLYWGKLWEKIRGKLVEVWNGIVVKVTDKVNEVKDSITNAIDGILTSLGNYVSQFKTAGSDLITGMKEGVLGAVSDLITAVVGAIAQAIQAAKDALLSHSPSRVFMKLGEGTMIGMGEGILEKARIASESMRTAMSQTVRPALAVTALAPRLAPAPVPITTNNRYSTMNLNFNGNIQNGMDLAALEAFVLRTVKRGVRR